MGIIVIVIVMQCGSRYLLSSIWGRDSRGRYTNDGANRRRSTSSLPTANANTQITILSRRDHWRGTKLYYVQLYLNECPLLHHNNIKTTKNRLIPVSQYILHRPPLDHQSVEPSEAHQLRVKALEVLDYPQHCLRTLHQYPLRGPHLLLQNIQMPPTLEFRKQGLGQTQDQVDDGGGEGFFGEGGQEGVIVDYHFGDMGGELFKFIEVFVLQAQKSQEGFDAVEERVDVDVVVQSLEDFGLFVSNLEDRQLAMGDLVMDHPDFQRTDLFHLVGDQDAGNSNQVKIIGSFDSGLRGGYFWEWEQQLSISSTVLKNVRSEQRKELVTSIIQSTILARKAQVTSCLDKKPHEGRSSKLKNYSLQVSMSLMFSSWLMPQEGLFLRARWLWYPCGLEPFSKPRPRGPRGLSPLWQFPVCAWFSFSLSFSRLLQWCLVPLSIQLLDYITNSLLNLLKDTSSPTSVPIPPHVLRVQVPLRRQLFLKGRKPPHASLKRRQLQQPHEVCLLQQLQIPESFRVLHIYQVFRVLEVPQVVQIVEELLLFGVA